MSNEYRDALTIEQREVYDMAHRHASLRRYELHEKMNGHQSDDPIRDALAIVWDDHCESYCPACLDSDYPREAVIDDSERIFRIAAFGAIRRAAEIAREHDLQAKLYRNDESEPWRDIEELQCARAVRAAIRAAIGSEKA